jgi:TRAP-type C4-dicarboxylate transport system permease small subunit
MDPGGAERAAPQRPDRFDRLVERLAAILAALGGLILIGVSVMVSASILGRWLIGREITGAFEIVQIGIAVAAFLFLPLCQMRNGNITVDAFTARLPSRRRAGLDALWAFVYSAVALVLAWRLSLGAAETIRAGMVTSMLQAPFGWAMAVGAAALVLLALAATVTGLRHLRETAL